jgi:glycosyltransferase involved in cell wall biosynthesis
MTINYGLLSTYPPTQCGLATFSAALAGALSSAEDLVHVVAVVDDRDSAQPAGVSARWVRGERGGATEVARRLDRWDVALIQHEFGIYPGRDGQDVLEVLAALTVPAITVLHTVPAAPNSNQRRILEELAFYSAALVTMTETARLRLIEGYDIDEHLIRVIPHGADDLRGDPSGGRGTGVAGPVVLTWGLLGEGKGIEWAIEAMADVRLRVPGVRYRVLGETHPKVLAQHGQRYRESLVARAAEFGVSDIVDFDDRYLRLHELHNCVRAADVVLLPYDSLDQVTSGVLIEAITATKPVVSTAFPHAVELLGTGAGLLVERRNPAAIADALTLTLTRPELAASMSARAAVIAPDLLWPAVADRYREAARLALRVSPVQAIA